MRFDGADLTGWTTGRTPTDVATILARAETDRPRLLRRRLPRRPLVAAHDHTHRPSPPVRPPTDEPRICRCTSAKLLRRAGSPDLQQWLAHTAGTRGCLRPVRLTGQLHTVETATGRHPRHPPHRRSMPDGVHLQALRRPPRLGLPTLRRDLPRRHLPTHPRRPRRRQRRPRPPSPATRPCSPPSPRPSSGPSTPATSTAEPGRSRPCRMRRDLSRLPPRPRPGLHRPPHRGPPLARPAALPGLLRPRPPRRLERLGRRTLAPHHDHPRPARSGRSNAPTAIKLRVSYGKVAEYQRRGVVHFHALIRLDGVDPADPDAILAPPDGITAADLGRARRRRRRHHRLPHTGLRRHHPRLAHRAGARSSTSGPLAPLADGAPDVTTEAVAAYLAKYATKATEPTGLPITGRMTAEAAEHYADPDTHLGRLDRLRLATRHPPRRLDDRAAAPATGTTPTAGCAAGPTCSASAATSPPRAAATPPPTKPCAPPAATGDAPPAADWRDRHHDTGRLVVDHRRRHHADRLRPAPRRHRLEHHRRRPTRRRSRRPRPRTPRPRPRRTHHRMTTERIKEERIMEKPSL